MLDKPAKTDTAAIANAKTQILADPAEQQTTQFDDAEISPGTVVILDDGRTYSLNALREKLRPDIQRVDIEPATRNYLRILGYTNLVEHRDLDFTQGKLPFPNIPLEIVTDAYDTDPFSSYWYAHICSIDEIDFGFLIVKNSFVNIDSELLHILIPLIARKAFLKDQQLFSYLPEGIQQEKLAVIKRVLTSAISIPVIGEIIELSKEDAAGKDLAFATVFQFTDYLQR